RPAPSNPMAAAGFFLYCAYLLSGFVNDWSLMLFGGKAYISTVAMILLPVAWLLSGAASRGLHHKIGLCWLAFLIWMILSTPFSVWRGGSAVLLGNYVPRAYLCYFYTCSFATSIQRCRWLMYINVAG